MSVSNPYFKKALAQALCAALALLSLWGSLSIYSIERAEAAPNFQINYQGKLTNASNVAVADGTYHMKFWLLTSPTAATTTAIWSEDRSTAAGDRITVQNGLFSVMLGSSTPLTGVNFNQTLYLGVEIGGSAGSPVWDGEMAPRKVLGTMPAAFEADRIDGLTSSQFLRSDDATTLATTTASTLLTITQSGSGDILNIFDSTTEVFTVLDGGNIGISTSSPYAKLSVHARAGETNTTLFSIASSTATATTTLFSISNTGSTTATNGFNITAGCYAVGGICLSSGITSLNGLTNSTQTFATTSDNGGWGFTSSGSTHTLNIPTASAANALGLLSNTNWTTFNDKVSSTSIDTESELETLLSSLDIVTVSTDDISSANLITLLSDETGTGNAVFSASPTFSGTATFASILATASSTIGGGTAQTGLTVSGNATTTGSAYVGGSITTTDTLKFLNVPSGVLATQNGTAIFIASTTKSLTGLGAEALDSNTAGSFNTAVGYAALTSNESGTQNSAFGAQALGFNTAGLDNVAVGYQSLYGNDAGDYNVGIGNQSLYTGESNANTAVGYQAGNLMNGGAYNTLLGFKAGQRLSTGSSNILIGGHTEDSVNVITSGTGNIGMANNLFFPSATANNQLNIGNLIFGTLPATSTAFSLPTTGRIGIATSSPFAKFSIHTNNSSSETTLFAIGSSTATATTTLFSISNTGSTTATNGFNITAGCYAVGGICLSSGITSLNGLTNSTQTFATTSDNGGWGFTSSGSTHTLNIPTASAANALGLLSNTNWTTFNDKVSSTSIDTESELETLLSSLDIVTVSTDDISSANLITLLSDETGTGNAVFSASPTFSGTATFASILATASSTIGGGTAQTGLTVSGNATTTGSSYVTGTSTILGNLMLGTTTYFGDAAATSTKFLLAGGGFFQQHASGTTYVAGRVKDAANLDGARAVAVQGRYAYVVTDGGTAATNDSLRIIDISNPQLPVVVGSLQDSTNLDTAFSIAVAGRYAYIANFGDSSLRIVDVSNPAAPFLVGGIKDNSNLSGPRGVHVSGRYAYVVNATDDSLRIIDVSNPAAPVMVGGIKDTTNLDGAYGVTVVRNYAYVTAQNDDSLRIIDVSNPAAPVMVGGAKDATNLDAPRGVAIAGRYAYVTAFTDNSLRIIDISTPTAPSIIGGVKDDSLMVGATAVSIAGRYAYVINFTNDSFRIIDISSSTSPYLVGGIRGTTLDGAAGVSLSGKYAYVANNADDSLTILDLGGIDAPAAHIGNIFATGINVTENLTVVGGGYFGGLNVGPLGFHSAGASTISANATTSLASIPALSIIANDNNVSSVVDTLSLSHTATGTIANGIGTGLLFNTEYAGTDAASTTATSTARIAALLTDVTASSPASALAFYTKSGVSDIAERMRLTATGNLGVGTTSPYAKLSVHALASDTNTTLFAIASSTASATSTLFTVLNNGSVGIGSSSPTGMLAFSKTSGITGTTTFGIHQYFSLANATQNAQQFGDYTYILNAPSATTTLLGKLIRIEDNSPYGNTVRGLEVQAERGTTTKGENTALSGFARTFGVRGTTQGDAGDTYIPAGVFAETKGTTQGNAFRAYSGTITSESLVYLFHDTSTFTGTGLRMNFGNTTGVFATTSKFVDLQYAGTSRFTVSAFGTTTIGDGTTAHQAGLQIGYGGLCVDNDGSCNASTTGRISSVSSYTGNSDLAETYFSLEELEPGDIVHTEGFLSIGKADQDARERILGVVSTKPGLLMGADDTPAILGQQTYPVALSGRVPIKLSTEGGPIKAGDKIMLSSIPGVGMKADKSGVIVGVALEDYDGSKAYSSGFIDQFGDDIADPDLTPDAQSNDPREQDGCSLGGGSALGNASCVKRAVATTTPTELSSTVLNPELQALERLRTQPADVMQTPEGQSVKVGKALLFVNLSWYQEGSERTILSELAATSSLLENPEGETLFERLKTLANAFVDGVLSVLRITADEVQTDVLCVGETCVDEEMLKALLSADKSAPVGQQHQETESTNHTPDTSAEDVPDDVPIEDGDAAVDEILVGEADNAPHDVAEEEPQTPEEEVLAEPTLAEEDSDISEPDVDPPPEDISDDGGGGSIESEPATNEEST